MRVGKRWLAFTALIVIASAGHATDDAAVATSEMVVLDGVSPDYPAAAQAGGFGGVVSVQAVVRADGSLGEIEVLRNSAPRLGFDRAAVEALKQWRFDPARVDGTAVDSAGTFTFHFEPEGRLSPSGAAVGYGFRDADPIRTDGVGKREPPPRMLSFTRKWKIRIITNQGKFVTAPAQQKRAMGR